jgi:hypothetical protein
MSAPGQSRPKRVACAIPSLPPLATELRTSRIRGFVPIADLAMSIASTEAALQVTHDFASGRIDEMQR